MVKVYDKYFVAHNCMVLHVVRFVMPYSYVLSFNSYIWVLRLFLGDVVDMDFFLLFSQEILSLGNIIYEFVGPFMVRFT